MTASTEIAVAAIMRLRVDRMRRAIAATEIAP